MADLYLHQRKLESIFELLGAKENDITRSIGWALSHSPNFLCNLLVNLFPGAFDKGVEKICLQEYKKEGGFTDVEIVSPNVHVIIEAKRGWSLPGEDQLKLYVSRLKESQRLHRALVVMAECSPEYAQLHLPKMVEEIPVSYFSWGKVHGLSKITEGTHAEKRLLAQLRAYLRRLVNMQNQESNLVYVVSLGSGKPDWSTISWRDIVIEKKHYFHPVGGGWPKEPPNYMGFRYDGKLQRIYHVESWKIPDDMHADFPEIKPVNWPPHFLYTLGNPIIPPRDVKTGKIYPNGRVWAMLDLLLTCNTISEARDLTRKRQSGDI